MRHRTSLFLAVVLTLFLLPAGPIAGAGVLDPAVQGLRTDPDPTDPPTPAAGAFRAVTPSRILDTRTGLGADGPIQANGMFTLQVTGRAGVPMGGVLAVALNITVTQPAAGGYLRVWASGSPPPRTSNLNFTAGATIANMAIVPVGPDGALRMFVGSSGSSQVLADVAGYYVAGVPMDAGSYVAVAPTRLLDTRLSLGARRLGPNATVSVQISGLGPVPAEIGAVAVNVAVTQPSASGFLRVWPGGADPPDTSNLNFSSRQDRAEPGHRAGRAGWDGADPQRLGGHRRGDRRRDRVTTWPAQRPGRARSHRCRRRGCWTPGARWGPRVRSTRRARSRCRSPGRVACRRTGRLRWRSTSRSPGAPTPGTSRPIPAVPRLPTGSSLNFVAGQTVPNLVVVPIGADGTITLHNGSPGTVQLLGDLYGYVLS